jgi:hypothetical protein
MFPQLRIYYTKYGQKTKENYRINYADVDFIEQYTRPHPSLETPSPRTAS